MDSKNIKSKLKLANQIIKEKDFISAIKLCQEILEEDRNNYMAYVLLGAAYQGNNDKEHAEESLKRAVDISQDQLLAWQGLASLYKQEQNTNQLFNVYQKLLELYESDPKNWIEVFGKLEKLKVSYDSKFIKWIYTFMNSDDKHKSERSFEFLLNFFNRCEVIPEDCDSLYEEVLKTSIKVTSRRDHIDNYKRYLKLLYKMEKYEQAVSHAEEMWKLYNTDRCPLGWLCRIYYERSNDVKYNLNIEKDMKEYYEKLLEFDKESAIAFVAKGVHLYFKEDYIHAKDALQQGLEIKPSCWEAWNYLTMVHIKLYCFEEALYSVEKVEELRSNLNDKEEKDLLTLKAEAMSRIDNQLRKGLEICNDLLEKYPTDVKILQCIVRIYIKEGNFNQVELYVSKLEEDDECLLLKAYWKEKEGFLEESLKLIDNNLTKEMYEGWIIRGTIYGKLQQFDEAHNSFMKAAKMAPYVYLAFYHLAEFYDTVKNNVDKARRCYMKAFELNPSSNEAALQLSNIYLNSNEMSKNAEVLELATKAGCGNWAWLRLGLHKLHVGDVMEAIKSLRFAVRADPTDRCSWESLGEAYMTKGSYDAALNCFEKLVKMDAKSDYVSLQLATIKRYSGLLDESLKEFRELINANASYIPGLVQLAETCVIQAKELLGEQVVMVCRNLCQEAIDSVAKIFTISKKNLYSVWKVLADACFVVFQLPVEFSFLTLPAFLVTADSLGQNDVVDNKQLIQVDAKELPSLAIRLYTMALKLNKSIAHLLWHDIAQCYDKQACMAKSDEDRLSYRRNAFAVVKKAISLAPSDWTHWNLLGLISLSKEINNNWLAQHCFIKSIQLEANNALAYCNLGVLYFKNGNIELANSAFKAAQSSDVQYVRAWIGQAIIAEMVNDDVALELFYQTTQLEYHKESALGFSEYLCKILRELNEENKNSKQYYVVKKLFAPQLAITLLTRYIALNKEDGCALNILGIILDWCGCHEKAISVTKEALNYVEYERKDKVITNLALQFYNNRQYEKSVEMLEKLHDKDCKMLCKYALALYKVGKYEEAATIYEMDELKMMDGYDGVSFITSVACLCYRMGSAEAKDLFIQSMTDGPISMESIIPACAYGLLTQDYKYAEWILNEIFQREDCKRYEIKIAILQYCLKLKCAMKLKGEKENSIETCQEDAISCLKLFKDSKKLDISSAISFCEILFDFILSDWKQYEECKHIIKSLEDSQLLCNTKNMNNEDFLRISLLLSMCHFCCGEWDRSLMEAQKCVHLKPDVAEYWAMLAVIYCALNDETNVENAITIAFYHLDKSINNNNKTKLGNWLNDLKDYTFS